jgi:hypothetical protein
MTGCVDGCSSGLQTFQKSDARAWTFNGGHDSNGATNNKGAKQPVLLTSLEQASPAYPTLTPHTCLTRAHRPVDNHSNEWTSPELAITPQHDTVGSESRKRRATQCGEGLNKQGRMRWWGALQSAKQAAGNISRIGVRHMMCMTAVPATCGFKAKV